MAQAPAGQLQQQPAMALMLPVPALDPGATHPRSSHQAFSPAVFRNLRDPLPSGCDSLVWALPVLHAQRRNRRDHWH